MKIWIFNECLLNILIILASGRRAISFLGKVGHNEAR